MSGACTCSPARSGVCPFLPRDAVLWPCVRLSVTSRCSIKTAKHRITQTKPHDSPGTLVFSCRRSPRNSTGAPNAEQSVVFGTPCRLSSSAGTAHVSVYQQHITRTSKTFYGLPYAVPSADWIISGPFRRPTTKNAGYKISLSPPQCACWGVSSGTLFNPHINLALCVDRQCVVCLPPYPLLPSRRTASSLCFPRYRKHPLRNAMSTSLMQVDRSRCIELRRRRCDRTRGHVILTASKSPTDRGPDGHTTNERRKCRTETCTSQACIRQQYYLYFTGLSSGELAELARHLCR